jgi:HEAT repeats
LALPVAVVSGLAGNLLAPLVLVPATVLSCYLALVRWEADASVRDLVGEKTAYAGPLLCFGLALVLAYKQHHYPEGHEELMQIMGDSDIERSETAARLLAAHGKEPLLVALHHPAPGTRRQAARQLGLLHDVSVLGALQDASQDPDAHVRMWVAIALGEIGGARALRTLKALASDREAFVRQEAAKAIERIEEGL